MQTKHFQRPGCQGPRELPASTGAVDARRSTLATGQVEDFEIHANRARRAGGDLDGAHAIVVAGGRRRRLGVQRRVERPGGQHRHAIVVQVLGDDRPILALAQEEALRAVRVLRADVVQHHPPGGGWVNVSSIVSFG